MSFKKPDCNASSGMEYNAARFADPDHLRKSGPEHASPRHVQARKLTSTFNARSRFSSPSYVEDLRASSGEACAGPHRSHSVLLGASSQAGWSRQEVEKARETVATVGSRGRGGEWDDRVPAAHSPCVGVEQVAAREGRYASTGCCTVSVPEDGGGAWPPRSGWERLHIQAQVLPIGSGHRGLFSFVCQLDLEGSSHPGLATPLVFLVRLCQRKGVCSGTSSCSGNDWETFSTSDVSAACRHLPLVPCVVSLA